MFGVPAVRPLDLASDDNRSPKLSVKREHDHAYITHTYISVRTTMNWPSVLATARDEEEAQDVRIFSTTRTIVFVGARYNHVRIQDES